MTFCQFIKGTPSRHDSCKCGRPTDGGWWCPEHKARVYILSPAEHAHELRKMAWTAELVGRALDGKATAVMVGF